MNPSRLEAAFAAHRGRTGLIPFVTAGYPSLDATLEMLRAFDRAGALAVEVGIPFSDPIADGPDIQRASEWALRERVGTEDVLHTIERFRAGSELPVEVMTYANPVVRMGAAAFAARAKAAGVDGVIISDLPPEESAETWKAFDDAGVDTITLVAPTTDEDRVPDLLRRCRGFVYCLARTGVTGQGAGYSGSIPDRVALIRTHTALPVAVGFGIASGDDARKLSGVADAVIVGAAFIRRITENPAQGAVERVESFARELTGALAG
ncbi:MAG: tryptophan synthase subunit alpha [Candidatus Eisenbacteria bacterium]|uniref:Tryptophan synthase alpha chain n=1 Tax=Eiseniibacteriota bacterium TaxID=2212470 RepID=A0A933SGE5_UNCEI|nr:tryptophan synthase subunit alpha [Candidatus Eisenbacteria bacterium]